MGTIEDLDSTVEHQDPNTQDPSLTSGSWIQTVMEYLKNGTIPKVEKKRTFRTRISRFVIIQRKLYKKSLAGPYLRCLKDHEAAEVLKDIHERDCGNHTGGRSLCSKALRTGYYWPTMKRDSFLHAQKCDAC